MKKVIILQIYIPHKGPSITCIYGPDLNSFWLMPYITNFYFSSIFVNIEAMGRILLSVLSFILYLHGDETG